MPLVIGATAAGFSIVRQLGYEEFGELYVAEHPRLPRQQVLHLIPAEISVDLDYRLRFNQQSDLAATLWHPNITVLTDRGDFEGQLWISTEYVDGCDAAELLGESYPDGMPARMVIEIVSAIADALDYAHDAGVLHRYVNPGNILVSKSPTDRRRIALTGFGVARPEGAHNTLTRAGLFIGTAGYTAPEQLMGEDVDGRIDQYALAASAFHLLTGSPAFAHFNPTVVVNRQLNDRPPRPSEVRRDLTEFDAIFARALSPDPVDRFRRARDFAKALESTGGTRSRTNGDAATAAFTAIPKVEDPPTQVVPAVTPEATEQAPAPTSNGRHASRTDDVTTRLTRPASHQLDESDDDAFDDDELADDYAFDDELADDDVADDELAEARKRRLKQSAGIAGVIAVVLLAWFMGVKALRSASQSNDSPAGGETTSVTTTTPAPAFSAPPIVTAPPLPPQPPIAAPLPKATTSAPATTAPKAPAATTPAQTTAQQPTAAKPPKTSTPTTGPNVLDTRPAVGMPCGAEGSVATSNLGGPVTCVGTPGGSAWEPPGGG